MRARGRRGGRRPPGCSAAGLPRSSAQPQQLLAPGPLCPRARRFGFDSIRVKFKPTAADLLTCEQSGRDLATAVKKRLKSKELAAAGERRAALHCTGAGLPGGWGLGAGVARGLSVLRWCVCVCCGELGGQSMVHR